MVSNSIGMGYTQLSEIRNIEARMKVFNRDVTVLLQSQETKQLPLKCSVRYQEGQPICTIDTLNLSTGQPATFTASDFFEALRLLRMSLEASQAKILCAGARKDAVCSSMSRQMALGERVYFVRIGASARGKYSGMIWDFASNDLVASVSEQQAYLEAWLVSLRTAHDFGE